MLGRTPAKNRSRPEFDQEAVTEAVLAWWSLRARDAKEVISVQLGAAPLTVAIFLVFLLGERPAFAQVPEAQPSPGAPSPPTGTFPAEQAAVAGTTPLSPEPREPPGAGQAVAPTVASESAPPPTAEPTMDWSVPREDTSASKDDSDGVLGPFRIGPVIGVGLPNLFHFGGTIKVTKYFGAGLNIGLIPEIKLSLYGEAQLSYREYDVYGRVYPFGGGFFLGAGLGYATVRGTIKDTVNSAALARENPGLGIPDAIAYEANGRVRTLILAPQLGYFFTWQSGFSLGFLLGAQIPIAPSEIEFETTIEGLPEVAIERYVAPLDEQVKDTLETVGRQPLPSFGLQFGWLL